MKTYCRAYAVRDLRAYPDWAAQATPEQAELADDDVVYLWDDYTVVRSPVLADQGLLWNSDTPQWRRFCTEELRFTGVQDESSVPQTRAGAR